MLLLPVDLRKVTNAAARVVVSVETSMYAAQSSLDEAE